ncbi:MAG: DUF2520 domain-containing protein [Pseudomonadota bacterium]
MRKKYTIIGDGKLARHFCHYFKLLNIQFNQWSRKLSNKNKLTLNDVIFDSDACLILIKDSEIEKFIQSNKVLENKLLVHFSGSLVIDIALGFHCPMTFAQELYSLEKYEKIPFMIEANSSYYKVDKDEVFHEIFPELNNPYFFIPKEEKAYYHSLCVMAGNFTSILWNKIFSEFEERFSVPAEMAHCYLDSITKNLKENYKQALTGPFERNDKATIEKNLKALEGDDCKPIYNAFLNYYMNKHNRDKIK